MGALRVVELRGVIGDERQRAALRVAAENVQGVKKVIEAAPLSAAELSHKILDNVQDFIHTVPKHNDVTALILARGNTKIAGPILLASTRRPA